MGLTRERSSRDAISFSICLASTAANYLSAFWSTIS
jgi:hypothetical protein